jgi:toxoflavin biosynthesis protein ToxD
MAVPKIFVSHSHKDDTFTERLVADLRQAGADAWMDKTDLGAGNFQQHISDALADCEWFVLVLTREALASPWVRQEVDAANRLKNQGQVRDLIFVQAGLLEHREIPPLWGVFNIFDATRDYGLARDLVTRAVGLLPGARGTAATPQPSAPQPQVSPLSPDIFPKRLADLGFQARTNQGVAYILPPLVAVPAGPFLMGTDPKRERVPKEIRPEMKAAWFALIKGEQPQHRVNLPAFEIARYPVTVAEYACFVRVGYHDPLEWQKQLPRLDHPVSHVTWYDAAAYAEWLAGRTGEIWRLPTEAEWEKAARGTDGRVYPWGDTFDRTRCNCSEIGVFATTPVGSYPSGASHYGVLDVAGNVCEWTTSLLLPYPYRVSDERVNAASPQNRVTRGGNGYAGNSIDLRGAYRTSSSPDLGSGFGGFRLVRAAPIS